MVYLSEILENQTAEIKYFKLNGNPSEEGLRNRIYEMGFYPGKRVRIIKSVPMPIVCLNGSRFAMSKRLSERFVVKRL